MYILGVDPGSRVTGYGIVSYQKGVLQYIASGSIKLSGHFPKRLTQLYTALREIIGQYPIDVCTVESIFVSHNANTALKLGQARGVCLLALTLQIGSPTEYAPRLVKKTVVGTGRASKSQVQFMVSKRLGLAGCPAEDAADALAVALCHIQHLQYATVQ